MCFLFACEEERKVKGSHKAPGSCPCCGGAVIATDVDTTWKLLFCLPIAHMSKTKFQCSRCSKRLVFSSSSISF